MRKDLLDFDVVAIGGVAADVSGTFDAFWNHESSVPIAAFANKIKAGDFEAWREELEAQFEHSDQTIYRRAVHLDLIDDLVDDRVPMFPATHKVITDDPDKLVHTIGKDFFPGR